MQLKILKYVERDMITIQDYLTMIIWLYYRLGSLGKLNKTSMNYILLLNSEM